ncbi:peptide ABC transporter substrate-binding protein [Bacillus litorisediminis]|uniref:peptide ABC transporter substrate-binding protein n=1 Tax=Bacillus litorisediminis TaxID=2922713 RepID=UPI001FAF13AF|nr:peptide ABC transporter substrate-binding protein [Bacillus litorisediminis]
MRTKFFSIFLFTILFLIACMNGVNPKEQAGEVYRVALEAIMQEDEALSSGMEFIAIDMSNFTEVTEQDKEEIKSFFQNKYNIEVKVATFEELKEQGHFDEENMVLDGVLLRIENVDFKLNNQIVFEGSKYRSGLGAVGLEVTVHYKDGKWQVKESKMTWIS